ncbi:MAG: DUF5686 family protein [Balneolaceae bacterium]|nr:DUF5686 family protein [Balneolaceae bacterium]
MKSYLLILSMLLAVLAAASPDARGQVTIRGTVTDAETGETLPSTNISIEGTYRGTITNKDGRYTLTIADSLLPARLRVRFIGYKTQHRTITAESDTLQDFRLPRSIHELGQLVVSGEDPAIRIMREVIRRKQIWRAELETYQSEAYTRQVLSNDTSIVMISETASTAYWDQDRGHREVVHSRRQTANIQESENFTGVSYVPNFYDDNIDVSSYDVMGVTHPDALDYYHFEIADRTTLDGKTVYEMKVSPKRKLQPLFEGTIWVLDEEYALLEVRLRPTDVVNFPPPVREFDTYFEQQFDNYGGDFWLPVDMRIEGSVKISMIGLEFPRIAFRQVARITDYRVNEGVPDSLYEQEGTISADADSVRSDSITVRRLEPIPLSQSEQEAYANLDSTATLEKAFQPKGFLVTLLDLDLSVDAGEGSGGGGGGDSGSGGNGGSSGDGFNLPGSLTPDPRFNRVDELYAGARYEMELLDGLDLDLGGGYSTGYGEWSYGGGLDYAFSWGGGISQRLSLSGRAGTATRFDSFIYHPYMTLLPNLLGYRNYYDYYRSEGVELSSTLFINRHDFSLQAGWRSGEHRSLEANSAWDLLGRSNTPRFNPPVDEGRLASVFVEAGYNRDTGYNFGITGMNRIEAGLEYAHPDLGGDFSFTRLHARIDWNFPTFLNRRLFPNTLDLSLTGGTSAGELPMQRMGTVDGSLGLFSPFGSLKTLRNRPYEGEHWLALTAEHNFRTVPFELLGLRPLVQRHWSLIVFGGIARTWISDSRFAALENEFGFMPAATSPVHYEAGVSLNGILGIFRVDFAQRLDDPSFMVSLSVSRYF